MNPVVAALATARLTQLITEDELTRPIRDAVNRWSAGAAQDTFKDRVAVLVSCTACMSVWSGGAILVASRFRAGRPLVRILAASGVALLIDAGRKRLEQES